MARATTDAKFPRVTVPGTTSEDRSRLDVIKERFKWWRSVGEVWGPVAEKRGPVYHGTANRKQVERRRAKNKVARNSRRINRGR